jgi:hypothetical protein
MNKNVSRQITKEVSEVASSVNEIKKMLKELKLD